MKQAVCSLYSLAPVQQSKFIITERKEKETAADHERRCWQERAHVTAEGKLFLPAMGFRHSITDAARFLSLPIPGRGKSTYTKHFEAGIMIGGDIVTETTLATVRPLWLFVPTDGVRGGGHRALKCFPVIDQWQGDLVVNILDDTITEPIFERVLREAGNFIGIGAFRPQKRGHFGRYAVDKIVWKTL